MGFAKGLGYGSIEIVNLFAYIATSPKDLKNFIKKEGEQVAIGKENNKYIQWATEKSELIVLGWGNNATGYKRCEDVIKLLSGKDLKCLEINKSKQPKHPLFKKFLDIPDETSLLNYIIY